MNNLSVEKKLIHFAHTSISSHLSDKCYRSSLHVIVNRLAKLDDDSKGPAITKDEAYTLLLDPPYSKDTSHITGKLREFTKSELKIIAIDILRIAAETSREKQDIHKSIQYISKCLWPLYSRDLATNMLGFDLQEYSDFFEDYTKDERIELKNKLLNEWIESGYISEAV